MPSIITWEWHSDDLFLRMHFCEKCAGEMKNVCPNCGGELVRRPQRSKYKG